MLLPWVLAAWLAGAWLARQGSLAWGAAGGFVLLAATVAAYLAAAGDAAISLVPRLGLLAMVAGPLFGAAGALMHRGRGGQVVGLLVLGAALAGQVMLLATIGPPLGWTP